MYEIMPMRRALARNYNPFALMDALEKSFFTSSNSPLGFKTDIKDLGDSIEIEAELPGFEKDNIKVEVDGDVLTISAERHAESEEKDENGTYIRRERSYGSFSRGFDISNIDSEGIKVKYADGILKLDMPKKGAELPEAKRIEIE